MEMQGPNTLVRLLAVARFRVTVAVLTAIIAIWTGALVAQSGESAGRDQAAKVAVRSIDNQSAAGPAVTPSTNHETLSIRIIARRNADGRIEFGARDEYGNEELPPRRRFPYPLPNHGRWLESSLLEFGDGFEGKIIARHELSTGRVEFGLRVEGFDDILPTSRFFPSHPQPNHNNWLRSTPIELSRPLIYGEDLAFLDDSSDAGNKTDGPWYLVDTGLRNQCLTDTNDPIVHRLCLLQVLYGGTNALTSDYYAGSAAKTMANDYGCPYTAPSRSCRAWTPGTLYDGRHALSGSHNAYDGGHSGWDAASRDRDRPVFHALGPGTVKNAGQTRCATIAIYDETTDHTVIYLHADKQSIQVEFGQQISVGDPLAREGNSCMSGTPESSDHVHVEVRPGSHTGSARGAGQDPARHFNSVDISVDPIPYLIQRIREAREDDSGSATLPAVPIDKIWDGDLIQLEGVGDYYVVKLVGTKKFKRHMHYSTIRLYGHLDASKAKAVSASTFNVFTTSTLVQWKPDPRVYHIGEGVSAGVKHHLNITGQQFAEAGLDWDAIFEISESELNAYGTGRAYGQSDLWRISQ